MQGAPNKRYNRYTQSRQELQFLLLLQPKGTWSAIAIAIAIALKRPTFSVYARAAAIVALASAIAALGRETQAGEVAVTCTNPFSGASWRIAIDYDRRTVDSNPARSARESARLG